MLNVSGRKSIFFSKVLDTYEEVDDGTSNEAVRVTRDDWSRKARWTLEAADAVVNLTSSVLGQPSLNWGTNIICPRYMAGFSGGSHGQGYGAYLAGVRKEGRARQYSGSSSRFPVEEARH
jgi:hypothetical protein